MNLKTFLRLEFKNFLGERAVQFALAFILLAGFFAMFQAREAIEKQKAVIARQPELHAAQLAKQLELNKSDLGNALYYLQFPTAHEPSDLAPFSVGQRDVHPFTLDVRILTLENQLYDSDIANPVSALFGNFDPSFVLVFLFPLLIVAFCYNLVSDERENGIWHLVQSQPVALGRIILWRFAIRFVVVCATAFVLIGAAFLYFQTRLDERFWYALLIAILYFVFWFALAAFVVSLKKSTVFNALSLLSIWILLAILAPALVNLAISTALPVSEAFEVTLRQREGYHEKWDRSKTETMAEFYEQYPDYRKFPIPEDKFSWGWYYAMQNAGDRGAAEAAGSYAAKLRRRDAVAKSAALFLPTVAAQLEFDRLAETDLASHLDYLASVRDYHRNLREFFYPHIFGESRVEDVNWQIAPKHEFQNETPGAIFPKMILFCLVVAFVFAAAARRNFAGRKSGLFR